MLVVAFVVGADGDATGDVFNPIGLSGLLFLGGLGFLWLGIAIVYLIMETRRRRGQERAHKLSA